MKTQRFATLSTEPLSKLRLMVFCFVVFMILLLTTAFSYSPVTDKESAQEIDRMMHR